MFAASHMARRASPARVQAVSTCACKAGVGAVLHEVLVTERPVTEPDGPMGGQWVIPAHGEHEGVVAKIGGGRPAPVDGTVDEGHVELAVGYPPAPVRWPPRDAGAANSCGR